MNPYVTELIRMTRQGTVHSSLVMLSLVIDAYHKAVMPPDCEHTRIPKEPELALRRALNQFYSR